MQSNGISVSGDLLTFSEIAVVLNRVAKPFSTESIDNAFPPAYDSRAFSS